MSETVRVGVVGCGSISRAYFDAARTFPIMEIVACADMNPDAAKAGAEYAGIEAMTVDELLANPGIEVVLNLTPPQAHTEINLRALDAGKHVHTEKPLAINRDDGKKTVDLAREKGLMLGCAPDTFLGGGLQTCRKLIDDGEIGRPVAGTAFMMCHGHENWHPNPGFLYLRGGGPMFDLGPYYVTALVNLLGPVKRVSASTAITFKERIATCKEQAGKKLPVEVPTHVAGTLDFESGALVTIVMSFDVWRHSHRPIEVHGELGSMQVPDPNTFRGPVHIYKPGYDGWREVPLSHGYTDNMRSIGLADMAYAIRNGRRNRCSGDLAYHVLDVMSAFEESSVQGRHIPIESSVDRPAPLPVGLNEGELDA